MKCIIIASGQLARTEEIDRAFQNADLILAADGGANHLKAAGRLPHVILGDLDSIDAGTRDFYQASGVEIRTFPARKDQTDTELCIAYALERGVRQMTLVGVTGHRLDHTLSNIFLLKKLAEADVRACILDAHNEIYLVTDRLELTGTPGDLLSLVPVSSEVTGVTLEGLAYPLENQTLERGTSLGISNYFTSHRAVIRISDGLLIVTKSRD